MQLSKTEEQLMEYIWQHGKIFMKDLIDCFPEPKPATTTVATLLKRVQEKGFVAYKVFGNSRQYFPLIEKTDYFSNQVNSLVRNFFNNSPLQFASFFTENSNLTTEELEDLKKIIDNQINEMKS